MLETAPYLLIFEVTGECDETFAKNLSPFGKKHRSRRSALVGVFLHAKLPQPFLI
jgi:hypothetical protein